MPSRLSNLTTKAKHDLTELFILLGDAGLPERSHQLWSAELTPPADSPLSTVNAADCGNTTFAISETPPEKKQSEH